MRVLLVVDGAPPRSEVVLGPRTTAAGHEPVTHPAGGTAPAADGVATDARADEESVAADGELLAALGRRGIDVTWAAWADVARGWTDLQAVDVVHLRPRPMRGGPPTGDRRRSDRRELLGRILGSDRRSTDVGDRRSANRVLAHVPPGMAVVVTLPACPAVPAPPVDAVGAGDAAGPVVPVVAVALPLTVAEGAAAATRPVHVITEDAGAAGSLAVVLPGTHAAGIAVIARGAPVAATWEPVAVEPPARPVVLVLAAPGSAGDAVSALQAAEILARGGLSCRVVVAGVGPAVRRVPRAVALAEAAGVHVQLLGRATVREIVSWRAAAAVVVVFPGVIRPVEGLTGLRGPGGPDEPGLVSLSRRTAHLPVAALAERLRTALQGPGARPVARPVGRLGDGSGPDGTDSDSDCDSDPDPDPDPDGAGVLPTGELGDDRLGGPDDRLGGPDDGISVRDGAGRTGPARAVEGAAVLDFGFRARSAAPGGFRPGSSSASRHPSAAVAPSVPGPDARPGTRSETRAEARPAPASPAAPSWDDIAEQTWWVYQQALRSHRR